MTGKAWPHPPRSLLALIVVVTLVPMATLLWLGWRLLDQDRMLEEQQVRQRVERAADLVVGRLHRRTSQASQDLLSGATAVGAGAAVLRFAGRLREAPDETFVEGEDLELRQRKLPEALAAYQRFLASHDRAVVAGALLRSGRTLQKSGQLDGALTAYKRLSQIDDVAISGVPAALVGLYASAKLLTHEDRSEALQTTARELDRSLRSGRWPLTPAVFALYIKDAAEWGGSADGPIQAESFAQVFRALDDRLDALRRTRQQTGSSQTTAVEGRTFTVFWGTREGDVRAFIASPEFVKANWLAEVSTVERAESVKVRLDDFDVTDVHTRPPDGGGYEAHRLPQDSALPWRLTISSRDPPPERASFELRRNMLASGFFLLVLMAATAGYLIVRAVNRELAAARMQADFVAAVSHEFRTPLTTLRQFTEMLREQRALSTERLKLVADAQSRATDRLTRLVESLLDFGRMEAGARSYRFQPYDCATLAKKVVEDYAAEADAVGHRIRLTANGPGTVDADEEALSIAIRNLLDNAVKYSPEPDGIDVTIDRHNGDVRIAVQDRGLGIPEAERSKIFTKFHRGEQARIRGVRGTGIGLAMVGEIVAAHRGRIELESAVGQGSTFTIVLPAKE